MTRQPKSWDIGRVKLLLKDGRIRTLPRVLHIPDLSKSLIYVSKLDDVGVDTLLGKGTCKMVRGEMVLMRGVQCGTLYKLLGRTYTDGCNSSIVLINLKSVRLLVENHSKNKIKVLMIDNGGELYLGMNLKSFVRSAI
jgi:hypothetical protein